MSFSLDAFEKILQEEKKQNEESKVEDKKPTATDDNKQKGQRNDQRNYSRKYSKRREDRHHRSGSKGDRHSRNRSNHRRSSRSVDQERQALHEQQKQEEIMKKQAQEHQRMAEQAKRDQCTVMLLRLHITANERDIYTFLNKAGVGKIRDIRIIKDPRSQKSKGVAYVEFYNAESVLMAMSLTGQRILGQDIIIQASQAQKNRAAAQAKARRQIYNTETKGVKQKPHQNEEDKDPPTRIFVTGLDDIGQVEDKDLRNLFKSFGTITYVDIHRDPITKKNKGFAFIHFAKKSEAKDAIRHMNNIEFRGKKMRVGDAPQLNDATQVRKKEQYSGIGGACISNDLDDDNPNQYIHSQQSRQIFMQKLDGSLGQQAGVSGGGTLDNNSYMIAPRKADKLPQISTNQGPVSNCLLLVNMFDLRDPQIIKNPNFFIDLKQDVIQACESYGVIEKVFVEDRSTQGNVWVKFRKSHDNLSAVKCFSSMNGRYYAKRIISANYVPENVLDSKVDNFSRI